MERDYRTAAQLSAAARMKKNVGVSRWTASYYDRLELEEWVFRTARGQKGYLIRKDSLTWGKRSSKHGDFGFLDKNITDADRRTFRLHNDMPYRASKSGALIALMADLRRQIKDYGIDFVEDYDGDEEPEPSLRVKMQRTKAAYRRLK